MVGTSGILTAAGLRVFPGTETAGEVDVRKKDTFGAASWYFAMRDDTDLHGIDSGSGNAAKTKLADFKGSLPR